MISPYFPAGRVWRLLLSAMLLAGASVQCVKAQFSDPPLLATLQLQSGRGPIGFAPATLDPVFDSNTFEYHIHIPFEHDEVQIVSATPVDDFNHAVEEPTIPPLLVGQTTPFEIHVSDFFSMGEPTIYTIYVTRGASNDVAVLSGLALSGTSISPSFGQLTFAYTASVSSAITSVTVTPIAQDATSTITVNGAPVASGSPSAPITLLEGETQIVVLVTDTDMDGDVTKAYTVDITRRPPVPDVDGDGIPDDYETANGLAVGINDARLDLDGDGLDNLGEYAFGSDPGDFADRNIPVVTRDAGGFLVVTFHRAIAPGIGDYRVEVSSDLENWSADVIDQTNPGTPETQVWRDANGGSPTAPSTRFVRILFTSSL